MTLPDNYSQPIDVQYQERASTDILQRSRNLENGPTAASSRLPRKPSEERFRCSICPRNYSQERLVTRHFRDVHEVSFCPHCKFKWHRSHRLREHLEEQHPDIDHRATLTEITRRRYRATTIKRRQKGQQAFPHAIGYDRRSWCQHPPRPLTPPLPTVLEATHVSLPAVPCVASPLNNVDLFYMHGVYDF
jgi:hypothetical protein